MHLKELNNWRGYLLFFLCYIYTIYCAHSIVLHWINPKYALMTDPDGRALAPCSDETESMMINNLDMMTKKAKPLTPKEEEAAAADPTTTTTTTKQKEWSGVAIAVAFNYQPDPQRNTVMKPSFEYIRKWYESIKTHPNLKGVILGDMYNDEFIQKYSNRQIEFIKIDPRTHPSFTSVPDSQKRKINDQAYFVAEWYLNSTLGQYEYVTFTDLHDVSYINDPMPYMRATDETTNKKQLYVGGEYKPPASSKKWMDDLWWACFHNRRPSDSIIHNSGILGGHVDVVRQFLRKMNVMFLTKVSVYSRCNMPVFAYLVEREYYDNVVTGYPLHTKFNGQFRPDFDGFAMIQHK